MANIVTHHNRPAAPARRAADWDPFEYMRELLQLNPFQDLSRRWLNPASGLSFAPRFDVREDNDCIVINADMPGIKGTDVDISLTGNRLCVRGQRDEERTESSRAYAMRERSFGSFAREFALPETIDAEHIEAKMQDGVLEVKVPKRAESKPKKIPLQINEAASNERSPNGGPNGEQPAQQAPREEGM